MELTRQEFGRRLQKIILAKGMNQSQLAREAGIGRDAVSTYVNGRSFPTPGSLEKMCGALGVTRDELFPNATMNAIASEQPEFEMRAAAGHPGQAWVRVNRMMSFAAASEIAKIINAENKGED